jgi:hypothetical protein
MGQFEPIPREMLREEIKKSTQVMGRFRIYALDDREFTVASSVFGGGGDGFA